MKPETSKRASRERGCRYVLVDFATPEKQLQPILPGDLSLAPGRRPAFPRSGLLFGRFLLRHRARQVQSFFPGDL